MKIQTLLLFTTLFFFITNISAQVNKLGLPLIKYFSPKEYKGHPFNWSIVQDKRGIIYIGNNDNGILEYDGVAWRQIKMPNQLLVRSLALDKNGTVYVGANGGEFGMLKPDKKGDLYYVSLSLLTDSVDDTNIWKTFATNNAVYFCSNTQQYKYIYGKSIKPIKLEKGCFWSFFVNQKIYVGNIEKGLMVLNNDKLELIKGGEFFKDKSIFMIQPLDKNKMVIGTDNSGLFVYNLSDKSVSNFINNKYPDFTLYNGTLFNKEYILSTIGQGALVFNKQGIRSQLTIDMGFPASVATDVFNNPDSLYNGILWTTLENGLAKAELNSPIRKFGKEFGINGDALTIIRFNNKIYAGTSTGLYMLETNKQNIPSFKSLSAQPVNTLFIFHASAKKEILLVGMEEGLYQMESDKLIPLDKDLISIKSMVQSTLDTSLLFLGVSDGLDVKKYHNGAWIKIKHITGINDVISLCEDLKGNIWLSSLVSGLSKIDRNYKVKHYDKNEGIHANGDIQINNFDNQLIIASPEGILKYNETSDKFAAYIGFGKKYIDGKHKIMGIHKVSGNKYILRVSKETKYWIELVTINPNGSLSTDSTSFLRLPNTIFWSVYNEADGISWFGTSEGLFTFDNQYKKNYNIAFNALVRSVIIGEDSVLFNGTFYKSQKTGTGKFAIDSMQILLVQPNELKPILKYKNNNLTFTYAAPFFEDEASLEYSHFLEGNDEGWSKWSKETKAIYTNLYEGTYTFRIKAKNVYGKESTVASYEFTIKPPWYRTIWAYIFYVIILIILIWTIVAIATYRMKQLNIAYGRYLPGSFLKLLDKARVIDLRLGDLTEKEVTIMFSDIRSYTNLSESMSPHDNFRFLVSYLSKIGDMLNQNTGFPVQYYGDGIMAMFHGDTDNALQAAIDMHKKVAEYSEDRIKKDRRELRIGIGLHTGKIIMGIRGDERRWEGGIVGDSVNLAARMEGLTKMYGAYTMLTDDTYSKLKNPKRFNIRFLGKVKVKGKDIPVGIYELLDGNNQHNFDLKLKTKTHFDAALEYYFEKDLEKAKELFTRVTDENPDDVTANHYLTQIKNLLAEGIPADWDGVEKLDKK